MMHSFDEWEHSKTFCETCDGSCMTACQAVRLAHFHGGLGHRTHALVEVSCSPGDRRLGVDSAAD